MTQSKGLALSRTFFEQCCEPLLTRFLPDLLPHMAMGLVGEGSECFGYDDATSRDHDWGPGLCLWLPEVLLAQNHARLDKVLEDLPPHFLGFASRMLPERRMGRVGPLPIEGFYARFLGQAHVPARWQEWRLIPEHFLAVCTNGEVFRDDSGTFTAIREALLAFYPEDVRLKKIAARCMGMAQAGQYNLPRSLQRGNSAAAMLCMARFAEQALSMVFLLNRRYMPFYKWAPLAASALPLLGKEIRHCLEALTQLRLQEGATVAEEAAAHIEILCAAVAEALRHQGLSECSDAWLLAHGPEVQSHIEDPQLRAMPVMME